MRTYETIKTIKGHPYRYRVTVGDDGKRRYHSLGRVPDANGEPTTPPADPPPTEASPMDIAGDSGSAPPQSQGPERREVTQPSPVTSGGTPLVPGLYPEGEEDMAEVQIVNNRPYLLDRHQAHILNGALAPMELVTLVSLAGMNTASELLKYSQFKIATALAAAQEAQEVAGKLSPTQQVAFDYMVTLYLETMGAINRDAMERIVGLIVGTPVALDTRSGLQKLVDGLLGG